MDRHSLTLLFLFYYMSVCWLVMHCSSFVFLWALVYLHVWELQVFAPILSRKNKLQSMWFLHCQVLCMRVSLWTVSVCAEGKQAKWTSTPWENLCVCQSWEPENWERKWSVCVCVCVRQKQAASLLFSRAGSETAGREYNRSCYILVVSLISAWGRGLTHGCYQQEDNTWHFVDTLI